MKIVTVAAPLCAPARLHAVTMRNDLDRYGFKNYDVHAEAQKEYMEIKVWFSNESAEWGEYVIGTLGYDHIGSWLNPKNEQWVGRRLRPVEGIWHDGTCENIKKDAAKTPITSLFIHSGRPANAPVPWKDKPRQTKPRTSQRTSRKRGGGWRDWFGF